jgi:nucleotide-binding universal stress UspA family protein
MILIAYDGSPDAQAAIEHAGELTTPQAATVLTIWEPASDILARVGAGVPIGMVDYAAIDRASEAEARRRAEEGAARVREAGLDAHPRVEARHGSIAGSILSAADEVGAEAIVLGTRGRTPIKSVLLGSVSHAVVQHADRPVIVVPSAKIAAERGARLR